MLDSLHGTGEKWLFDRPFSSGFGGAQWGTGGADRKSDALMGQGNLWGVEFV